MNTSPPLLSERIAPHDLMMLVHARRGAHEPMRGAGAQARNVKEAFSPSTTFTAHFYLPGNIARRWGRR